MTLPANLPEMTHAEVLRKLTERVNGYPSLYHAARALGVSRPLLQFVLSGKRNIGPALLKALGLKRVTLVIHRYGPAAVSTTQTVAKVPAEGSGLGPYRLADRQEPE